MRNFIVPRLRDAAEANGWSFRNKGHARLEKDGYEIYFGNTDGFELTVRDPETMDREIVFEQRGSGVGSPLYVATLLYIIRHVEEVVSYSTDRDEQ